MKTFPSKKNYILKIHLFHTQCSSNLLTYLLTFRLSLTDIKLIMKIILEHYLYIMHIILNIKPKMCFNVTINEHCMIFE